MKHNINCGKAVYFSDERMTSTTLNKTTLRKAENEKPKNFAS